MNNITVKTVDNLIEKILNSDNIYIASHVHPDGDNIGSILAMGLAIKKLGKKVRILKSDTIPSDYTFLPHVDLITDYDTVENIDLFIALDCSDIDRLGSNKELLEKSSFVINIDHHVTNTNFGDINLVDSTASATGEIVFSLINRMDIDIDKDIASCLYTAISTDTGSFKYESVTDRTHEIIAKLLRTGMDKDFINIKLYHSRSMERTNLFIKSFSTLTTYKDEKIAVVKVTQDMLNTTNTLMEDTEGIISFIRDIDSVEVACLLKEFDKKETKVSLRSKSFIDVSKISGEFDGGGHKRAAGCTINEDISMSEKLIVEEILKAFR